MEAAHAEAFSRQERAGRGEEGGYNTGTSIRKLQKKTVLTDLICQVNKMTALRSFLFLFLLPNMPKKLQIWEVSEVKILIIVLGKKKQVKIFASQTASGFISVRRCRALARWLQSCTDRWQIHSSRQSFSAGISRRLITSHSLLILSSLSRCVHKKKLKEAFLKNVKSQKIHKVNEGSVSGFVV